MNRRYNEGQKETHTINTQKDDQGSRGSWTTQEEQIRLNKVNTLDTGQETIKIGQETTDPSLTQ